MPSLGRSISLKFIHERANPAYIVLGNALTPTKETTVADVQSTFDPDSATIATNFYQNATLTSRFFADVPASTTDPTYCALVVYNETASEIIELIAIEPTIQAPPLRYTFRFKGLTI